MKRKGLITLTLALSVAAFPAFTGASATSMETTVDSQGNEVHIDGLPKAASKSKENFDKPAVVEKETKAKVLNENGKKIGHKKIDKTEGSNRNVVPGQAKKHASNQSSQELCLLFCDDNDDSGSGGNDGGSNTSGEAKTATVLIAADEEYRAAHSDWQTYTKNIIENADNGFTRDHNIDLEVKVFAEWSSQGNNANEILQDLDRDWNGEGYDFVVGFTRDSNFNSGGIAYVYPSAPNGSAVSVNLDQGAENTWHAAQHEISHNYGLGHDAQGSGIKCIMNYDYSYQVDYWGTEHDNQIEAHRNWYGN
ncbi:zinc-dependent metalloprotease [Pontibacillus salicampi]|uniref:Zinc-dependent metalloprotease n=1 Tax=Pontibacillus salicampi TaxID=1449801 RepID=A0ABV6LSQ2_9BACI